MVPHMKIKENQSFKGTILFAMNILLYPCNITSARSNIFFHSCSCNFALLLQKNLPITILLKLFDFNFKKSFACKIIKYNMLEY